MFNNEAEQGTHKTKQQQKHIHTNRMRAEARLKEPTFEALSSTLVEAVKQIG